MAQTIDLFRCAGNTRQLALQLRRNLGVDCAMLGLRYPCWTLGFLLLCSLACTSPAVLTKVELVRRDTPFEDSFVFVANDGKSHPGVMILHGSGGGSIKNMWPHALRLAAQGYAVMTYCWFDCGREALMEPATMLANIELTDVVAAMSWFEGSRHVATDSKLGLYGVSRGAELAILLASLQKRFEPQIAAVAVHAPSDVVVAGFNPNWLDRRCWLCSELDTCEQVAANWNASCGAIQGTYSDPYNIPSWSWEGATFQSGERIEIENFGGEVFVTSGELDAVWSADRTRRIEQNLRAAGRVPEVHIFSNEGHGFTTKAENRRMQLVISFFQRTIGKP